MFGAFAFYRWFHARLLPALRQAERDGASVALVGGVILLGPLASMRRRGARPPSRPIVT